MYWLGRCPPPPHTHKPFALNLYTLSAFCSQVDVWVDDGVAGWALPHRDEEMVVLVCGRWV